MGMHLKQNELSLNILVLLVHESDLLYGAGLKSKFAGSLFGNVKWPHLDRYLGEKKAFLFSFFNLATEISDFKKYSSIHRASFELFAYYSGLMQWLKLTSYLCPKVCYNGSLLIPAHKGRFIPGICGGLRECSVLLALQAYFQIQYIGSH